MGSGEDKRVKLFPVVKRSNVTRRGQGEMMKQAEEKKSDDSRGQKGEIGRAHV